MSDLLQSVERMKRDIRAAAGQLSAQEARYLVDAYYQMQEDRIRAAHRVRALADSGEPNLVVQWLQTQSDVLEQQIKGALDKYSLSHPVGRWMRSVKGVGPVIAAGFLANINIERSTTVGRLWKYCGVAPGQRRKRGEKTDFNPSLKRLCFLTGECFKRLQSDDPKAYYRHVYDARKAYETEKNARGDYAEQAATSLAEKKFGAETQAKAWYDQGMLPPARIDLRSCRYATKLFLSHMHEVWWRHEYGTDPAKPYPLPYAIAHLGHVDLIAPPQAA